MTLHGNELAAIKAILKSRKIVHNGIDISFTDETSTILSIKLGHVRDVSFDLLHEIADAMLTDDITFIAARDGEEIADDVWDPSKPAEFVIRNSPLISKEKR